MKLVIGGAFQNKKQYAMETFGLLETDFADGRTCGREAVFQAAGILQFHEYVRRLLTEGEEVSALADRMYEKNPQAVILCDELGSGVVPAEAFDRAYRETVGRICCELAEKAEEVHRVVCGIGTVIKHG